MTSKEFWGLKRKYGYIRAGGKLYAVTGTPFYLVDTPEVLLEAADMDGNLYDAYFERKEKYVFDRDPKYGAYQILDVPWQKAVKRFVPDRLIKTGRRMAKE